jgi:hypothetical protein
MLWQVDKKQYLIFGFLVLKIYPSILQNKKKRETKSTIKILKIIFTDFVIKKYFTVGLFAIKIFPKSILQNKEK